MAKETRKEYLERRVQEVKNLGRTVDVKIPNNPTKAQLTALDDKINKVLYPSGVYGVTAPASTEISAEEAALRAAQERENARIQAERTNWIEQLSILFTNYGLGSLAPKIKEFIQQGYTGETVTLKLQETEEYKQRFIGNVARQKAGMSVLSPKEYLATEDAYRQVLRTAGLPQGFYDQPDDFSKFISIDVSPTELKSRVDLAQNAINATDPYYTRSLQEMYGLSTGDMIAQVLDPQKALPLITRQAQAVQFGAAAARQGLKVTTPTAEQYAGMGITSAQAEQGFGAIAQVLPTAEKLGQIYKDAYTQEQAMAETFGGPMSAEAIARRKRLTEMERSTFAGQSGVGQPSLGRTTQGQF